MAGFSADDRDLYPYTLRFLIAIAGVISLPYAEILEPFEGWFDLAAKSSRIDYYHGKIIDLRQKTLTADSVF